MSHIEGIEQLTANIAKVEQSVVTKMTKRVGFAGDVVYNSIKKRTELRDHPQWLLNMMGNPYHQKWGTDTGPHGDDGITHQQTGILHRNIEKVEDFSQDKAEVAIGVNPNKAGDYIREVIEGTPKVRPRPFLTRGFAESKDAVQAILRGDFGG